MKRYYIATISHGDITVAFTVAPGCKCRQDERTAEQIAQSARDKGHRVQALTAEDHASDAEYFGRMSGALYTAALFRWGSAEVQAAKCVVTHRIEVPDA